jgi:hypothetical protein
MEALGWSTTRKKGPVHAKYFKRSERYQAPTDVLGSPGRRDAAKRALEAIVRVGDDKERAETGALLLASLAATRQAEGRPF